MNSILKSNDLILINIRLIQTQLNLDSVFLPNLDTLKKLIKNDKYSNIVEETVLSQFYQSNFKLKIPFSFSNIYTEILFLTLFGFFNQKNQESHFFKMIFNGEVPKEVLLRSEENKEILFNLYSEHVFKILNFLNLNSLILKDLKELKREMMNVGIFLNKEIYKQLELKIYSNIDKLLIIITPGDNFWFKSNKPKIADQNYERKYDGKDVYIFYNWDFIEKFFTKLASHPRCKVGLLSSLCKNNLKENFEVISQNEKFSKLNLENQVILFDEETHDKYNIRYDLNHNSDNSLFFRRNIKKIIENIEREKSIYKINYSFNEDKILILESEKYKSISTTENLIFLNCFSENLLYYNPQEKEKKINIYIDMLFDYILEILNTNGIVDIPDYLKNNPFFIKS